jgi:transportin-1
MSTTASTSNPANWCPNEAELRQCVELLKSSQSTDNTTQRHVQQVITIFRNLVLTVVLQKVDELNKHPQFGNYLIFILSTLKNDGLLQSHMQHNCTSV